MAKKSWIKSNALLFRQQVASTIAAISPAPGPYGLVAGDLSPFGSGLTGLVNAIDDHQAASDAAEAATQAKNAAQQALETLYRHLNNKVQAANVASDALKEAAGLPTHDRSPTPVPVPTVVPGIVLEPARPGQQPLRIVDSANPNKRGKPTGVTAWQIFLATGTTAPTDVSQCRLTGTSSKSNFTISFIASEAGKTAWIIARALNAKGEFGPLSPPTPITIAASLAA